MPRSKKKLEDMNFQEIVEFMNDLRNHRHYASMKGFDMMVKQIDLELEKAENAYYNTLEKEKTEYDKRHNKGDNDDGDDDDHIIFQTSENDE